MYCHEATTRCVELGNRITSLRKKVREVRGSHWHVRAIFSRALPTWEVHTAVAYGFGSFHDVLLDFGLNQKRQGVPARWGDPARGIPTPKPPTENHEPGTPLEPGPLSPQRAGTPRISPLKERGPCRKEDLL